MQTGSSVNLPSGVHNSSGMPAIMFKLPSLIATDVVT